jgi:hypothetical protein
LSVVGELLLLVKRVMQLLQMLVHLPGRQPHFLSVEDADQHANHNGDQNRDQPARSAGGSSLGGLRGYFGSGV